MFSPTHHVGREIYLKRINCAESQYIRGVSFEGNVFFKEYRGVGCVLNELLHVYVHECLKKIIVTVYSDLDSISFVHFFYGMCIRIY